LQPFTHRRNHLPGSCIRRIFLLNSFHPDSTFPSFDQTPEVVVFPPDGTAGEGGGSMVEFHLTVGVNDIVGEFLTQCAARVEGCLQRDSLLGSVISSSRRRHSKIGNLSYPGDRGISSEQTRRLKTGADLALSCGATYDAFDMYGKAAKALEADGDKVWAAACYAGLAASAVAMADLGGGEEWLAGTEEEVRGGRIWGNEALRGWGLSHSNTLLRRRGSNLVT
jgi:hypothetical protein